MCPKIVVWEWGNFGSQKVRLVLIEQFSTVRLQIWFVPMISGYLHLENRKDHFWPNLCPFWGNDPFWVTKTMRSHNFRTACSWHLQFGRYMLHNDVKNVALCKFPISFRKWAYFGPQNVWTVLNRAIFNRWASNLDCVHDFKISPPAKQKTPIWGNLCPFLGSVFPQFFFYLNFFYQIFFYPIFFLPKFFFTQIVAYTYSGQFLEGNKLAP